MSNEIPENLKYTKDHEWAKTLDDSITVGITDFAQNSLGDIVFVELPEVGDNLEKDQSFGVVESIKSVSDLYSPVTGEVVEVNEELNDKPELCNESPYDAWIVKIKLQDSSQLEELMDASAYRQHCEEEG